LEIGEIRGAETGSCDVLQVFEALKLGSFERIFEIGVSGTVCSSFAVVFGGCRALLGGRTTVSFVAAMTAFEFKLAAIFGAAKAKFELWGGKNCSQGF